GGARQLKICHVCTSDQQYESNRAKHDQKPGSSVSDHLFVQRHNSHSDSREDLRVLLRQLLGDETQRALSLLHRYSCLEPRDDAQIKITALRIIAGKHSRCPHIRWLKYSRNRKGKVGWKDADHEMRLLVQNNRLSDYLWVCTEVALPEAMAQHHDVVLSLLIFSGRERPPQDRPDPQHLEKVSCNEASPDSFRFGDFGQRKRPGVEGRHVFEDALLLFVIKEVGRRNRSSSSLPNHNQLAGV